MEFGIQVALEKGYKKIILQADSRNAVDYVKGRNVPWQIRNRVRRIQKHEFEA